MMKSARQNFRRFWISVGLLLLSGAAFAQSSPVGSLDHYLENLRFASGFSGRAICADQLSAGNRGVGLKARIQNLHAEAANLRQRANAGQVWDRRGRVTDPWILNQIFSQLHAINRVPAQKLRAYSLELFAINYELNALTVFAHQLSPANLRTLLQFTRAILTLPQTPDDFHRAELILHGLSNLTQQLAWTLRFDPPLEVLRELAELVPNQVAMLRAGATPFMLIHGQLVALRQGVLNEHRLPDGQANEYIKIVEKLYKVTESVATLFFAPTTELERMQKDDFFQSLELLRDLPGTHKFPVMQAAVARLLELNNLTVKPGRAN